MKERRAAIIIIDRKNILVIQVAHKIPFRYSENCKEIDVFKCGVDASVDERKFSHIV